MKSDAAASVRDQSPPAKQDVPLPALDASAGSPREIWHDFFSKRRPDPSVVRDLLLELHESGKHDHAIAAIEAALLNGQSQPWMYEVLALSMQIAGRPKDQVERVLYSTVDFAGADYQSMLYSAAYLTRFERHAAALRMYRQASRLEPARAEPYVLALKLARRFHDADATQWAATGVLTFAWTADHEKLHQQAIDAAHDALRELRDAGQTARADALAEALAEAQQRDLELRLSWNGVSDLDLIVEEPWGTVCSSVAPYSPGGGVLVHDGYGPDQSNCHDDYVCALGAPGTYRVKVRHVWGSVVGKRAQLTITRYRGTPRETTRTLTVPVDGEERVVRVSLPDGRRTDPTPVPADSFVRTTARRKSRPSLLQMLGGLGRDSRQAARRFSESRQPGATLPAGQQVGFTPVITTLSDGVFLSAMAVVSGDRRYVRLTLAPAFTTVTDVFTFSFVTVGGGGGAGGGGGPGGGGVPGGGLPGAGGTP